MEKLFLFSFMNERLFGLLISKYLNNSLCNGTEIEMYAVAKIVV